MKKLLIFGLGLTLGSLALNTQAQTSQTSANDQMRFGIKAGANLMKLGKFEFAGSEFNTDYKVGFQAGVYADLPMGGGFAFLPEIIFSQKGGKVDETVNGNTGEIDATISYIDVPVLIGYKATPEFTVFAGPQASFLVSQKSEILVNGEQQGDDITDTDNMRKSVAGGVVGLGYSITPNIKIDGRYMMDFQSATKEDQNQDKLRNSGFALSLGYTF